MSSTFLSLTNDVLAHLGETELTEFNFDDARSIFKTVKSSVNKSISHINSEQFEWPFNAYEHSHVLVPGKEEYIWPDNFKSVDWESFRIDKDDSLSVNNKSLRKINRDEWYHHRRDTDDDNTDGRSVPSYVFSAHGNGFGITPSPDKAYTIRYRYFRDVSPLVNATDECNIPSQWDHVIFLGALWYGNLFKESPEGVQILDKKFRDSLSSMRKILINRTQDVTSTVINHGGGPYKGASGTNTSPVIWNW